MPLVAPGGDFVVTVGSDEILRAYDRRTFAPWWELPLPAESVECAAVAPVSGLLHVGDADGAIRRFDLGRRTELPGFRLGHAGPAVDLVFPPDESCLFVTHAGGARLARCDVATGAVAWEIEVAPSDDVLPRFDTARARVLVESLFGRLELLDAETGVPLESLEHPYGPARGLEFDAQSDRWALLDADGVVHLFGRDTGRRVEVGSAALGGTEPALIGFAARGAGLLVQVDTDAGPGPSPVVALDPADGREIGRADAAPLDGRADPSWLDGVRLVALVPDRGDVVLLDPSGPTVVRRWDVTCDLDREVHAEDGYLLAARADGRPLALHPLPAVDVPTPDLARHGVPAVGPSRSRSFDAAHADRVLAHLRGRGYDIEPGLTDAEVAAVESEFEIGFPADLRLLLQRGLPTGGTFPDWRSGDRSGLRKALTWPLDGVLWDVENDAFWADGWGPRPETQAARRDVVTTALAGEPALIPVFGHRFLVADPTRASNPVLSVWQTDVIVYGDDLGHYLTHEFGVVRPGWEAASRPPRGFWGDVLLLD